MDDYLILEFATQNDAQSCLNTINSYLVDYYQQQGYEITNGAIIGKNSATGADNPQALTTSWDTIKASPDSTYYFASPFPKYNPPIQDMNYTEKAFPDSWQEKSV